MTKQLVADCRVLAKAVAVQTAWLMGNRQGGRQGITNAVTLKEDSRCLLTAPRASLLLVVTPFILWILMFFFNCHQDIFFKKTLP